MNHADHVALLARGVRQDEGGTWADLGAGTGAFTLRVVFDDEDARPGQFHSRDLTKGTDLQADKSCVNKLAGLGWPRAPFAA